jgi:hypothetical protein
MVAEARLHGDVEQCVRTWARGALPSIDGRVFFGANNQAAMPQVSLFRVSGPDHEVLIQFDVWASKSQGKAQAAQLAAELETAADGVGGFISDGVQLKSARIEDNQWLPDDESNLPRYIVQVTFAAWAVGPPAALSGSAVS